MLGTAVPAMAATEYPAPGAMWNYGTGGGRVWSDLLYSKSCHSSSVQGKYYDSDSAAAGYWSEASAPSRWYAIDKSYYKLYC